MRTHTLEYGGVEQGSTHAPLDRYDPVCEAIWGQLEERREQRGGVIDGAGSADFPLASRRGRGAPTVAEAARHSYYAEILRRMREDREQIVAQVGDVPTPVYGRGTPEGIQAARAATAPVRVQQHDGMGQSTSIPPRHSFVTGGGGALAPFVTRSTLDDEAPLEAFVEAPAAATSPSPAAPASGSKEAPTGNAHANSEPVPPPPLFLSSFPGQQSGHLSLP